MLIKQKKKHLIALKQVPNMKKLIKITYHKSNIDCESNIVTVRCSDILHIAGQYDTHEKRRKVVEFILALGIRKDF